MSMPDPEQTEEAGTEAADGNGVLDPEQAETIGTEAGETEQIPEEQPGAVLSEQIDEDQEKQTHANREEQPGADQEEDTVYIFTAEQIDEATPVVDSEDGTSGNGAALKVEIPGITYPGGSKGKLTISYYAEAATLTVEGNESEDSIKVYVPAHTVVWIFEDCPAGMSGTVKLTVRVSEDAEKFWNYDNPEWGPSDNQADDRVRNKAGVMLVRGRRRTGRH